MDREKNVAIVNWDKSLNNMGDMILIDSASYLVNWGGMHPVEWTLED